MKIGYARVSSSGQSLELQLEALAAAGCEKIYSEKESGRTTTKRLELERAIDQLRDGDELVITRLDRLARSVPDLYGLLGKIADKGGAFTCLQQPGANTNTPTGKLLLGILGLVAEFENDLRRDRQLEGIAAAKARGAYRGGKRRIDAAAVRKAMEEHGGATEAAKALGIGRASVYRILAADDAGGDPTEAM